MWPRGKTIKDATVIGKEYTGLYKLKRQLEQALVHDLIEPSELWNRMIAHVHYRELLMSSKEISRLTDI